MHAKVENNNVITLFSELPKSHILPTGETVCGFDLLADAERIEKAGIYPIVNLTPEYVAATHELGEAVYTVKANCVELVYQIIEKSLTATDVEARLIEFAAQKDFDLNETDKMLKSGVQTWIDEATTFNQLWTQTWQAFYAGQPLPELIWS